MTRQAQVGLFALIGLLGLFAIFYVLSDLGTRSRGYRIGVHFNSAAGLHNGALVYESGVAIGSVVDITLLPDFTVDTILAIKPNVDIPRDSRFIIQAPLTGDPNLVIVPPIPPPRAKGSSLPTAAPNAVALLPHEVLPLDQQPQGINPATLSELLEQGQGEIKRVDALLSDLENRAPRLLDTLQSALNNANEVTITANQSVRQLSEKANGIADTLGTSLQQASSNVVALTGTLNTTVSRNSGRVDSLLASLNTTATSLSSTVDSLRTLAQNPEIRSNIVSTTRSIAQTTETIAAITGDLRQVTGNPQTQAQIRDTVANLDATMQKTNSLLGALGGTSSVYGVDRGATPAPGTPPRGQPRTSVPGGVAAASPAPGAVSRNLKAKIGQLAKNLVEVQIRVSELSPQRHFGGGSPLLTADRGPQTDFNIVALPKGSTSLFAGANDIGARTTYNFAALGTFGGNVRIGGGVLYSRLGVLGLADYGRFGIEGRLYDLRIPTLDGYGHLNATQNVRIFGGERDIFRPSRRTVFGLQLQF